MVCYALPVVVIMVCYAEPVVVNHGVLCWWLGIMLRYAEAVVVNHGVLILASGCEACCVMLSQWL
jgi:hypothetical protein